jgi:4,5-dihydroxyphthalate decarboxylase
VFREARAADTASPKGVLDPYRFGVEAVRQSLERVIDYSFKQQMIPRKFGVDELFDETTRKLGA